jgi:UDP-glucuronate decarboxylase
MKRAPRSRQRHDLYAKYHDYDSEISDLLGECGIEGFVRLMDTDEDIDGPVNIGNPSEITVNELAHQVIALAGSRSRLVYHPLPIDDPRRRKPDISRALTHLHWSPQVPLQDGLKQTIAYFTAELQGERVAQRGAAAS